MVLRDGSVMQDESAGHDGGHTVMSALSTALSPFVHPSVMWCDVQQWLKPSARDASVPWMLYVVVYMYIVSARTSICRAYHHDGVRHDGGISNGTLSDSTMCSSQPLMSHHQAESTCRVAKKCVH